MIRAWQTIEEVRDRGQRTLAFMELDLAIDGEGTNVDIRYSPFTSSNQMQTMADEAQWWSQFGSQAPTHRSVLILASSSVSTHFSARYPNLPLPKWNDADIVSANAGEVILLTESLEIGDITLHDGVLQISSRKPANSTREQMLRQILDTMYREGRVLWFPAGKNDYRSTSMDVEKSIDIIVPFSTQLGLLSDNLSQLNATAGTNGGFFIHAEEEFYGDPFSSALAPVGLIISHGKVLSPPLYRRSAILINQQAQTPAPHEPLYSINNPLPSIVELSLENYALRLADQLVVRGTEFPQTAVHTHFTGHRGNVVVADLNPAETDDSQCAFYNRLWTYTKDGRTTTYTPASSDRVEICIVGDQVMSVKGGGESFIPLNGFIVSLPRSACSHLVANTLIAGDTNVIEQAIYGTPRTSPIFGCQVSLRLIEDGKVTDLDQNFGNREEFVPLNKSSNELGIPPVHLSLESLKWPNRSFIGFGIRSDFRCFFVAIEGCEYRSFVPGSDSVGGNICDLAAHLLALGCEEAVALDSGGSAEMSFRGISLIRPSDRNDIPMVPFHRYGPGGWTISLSAVLPK